MRAEAFQAVAAVGVDGGGGVQVEAEGGKAQRRGTLAGGRIGEQPAQTLAGVRTEGLRALHGGRRQARQHRLLFSQGNDDTPANVAAARGAGPAARNCGVSTFFWPYSTKKPTSQGQRVYTAEGWVGERDRRFGMMTIMTTAPEARPSAWLASP